MWTKNGRRQETLGPAAGGLEPAPAPSGADRFILQPVARAAAGMNMVLARPEEFAGAAPVVASLGAANRGTLTFSSLSSLVPITSAPVPITLSFTGPVAGSPGSMGYTWTENGVTQSAVWTTGQPLVVDGRIQLELRGVPLAGDVSNGQSACLHTCIVL